MKKKIVFLPYDMDTAIGITNEGLLAFGYNLEDIDQTEGGADVFNGQQSVLWKNVRAAFFNELKSMYQQLRSSGALSYDKVEEMFEEHQDKWPEAIFNEDAWFKYLTPLVEKGNASYLGMLQGSKEEQRKWWLYNRFKYIDSKYNAGDSLSDVITVRGYAKDNITVTPYADIYATVKYGSYLVQKRAERNKPITLECPLSNVNDTEIYTYSASQLASVGDLSGLQVGYADFSKAVKLQSLKLGDSAESYSNGNLTELYLGNNELLRVIDIRNCPKLTQAVDISGCSNVEEVYFDGTSITGLSLPNGGILKVLHLPGTMTNLTIRNQTAITDFSIPSYSSISTLWLENVSDAVDPMAILKGIKAGSRVRIFNFTWNIDTVDEINTLLDLFDTMRGIDESYGNMEKAQIHGVIHVPNITGAQLKAVNSRYSDIMIRYDHITSNIYYYDFEGENLLYTEEVRDGGNGKYSGRPSKAATSANTYDFIGWNTKPNSTYAESNALKEIIEDRNVYAAYRVTGKTYTIRFYSGSTLLQTSTNVAYGGRANYSGTTPQKTGVNDPEDYEFMGWEPQPVNITGDTACYAQFRYTGYISLRIMERTLGGAYVNDRITKVGRYAFYQEQVTSVDLPNVKSIGSYAFRNCRSLKEINIPETLTMHEYAFYDCSMLTTVSFPKATLIENSSFCSCGKLVEVDLPKVQRIGSSCFSNCASLANLTLGNDLTRVDDYAFYSCTSLPEIFKFGSKVTWLGSYLFRDSSVKEVHLNSKLTNMSSSCFSSSSITDIYVPWAEGEVSYAPWGATNATVHYES